MDHLKSRELLFVVGLAASFLGGIAVEKSMSDPINTKLTEIEEGMEVNHRIIQAEIQDICVPLKVLYDQSGPHYAPGEEDWPSATTIPGPDC